MPRTNYRQVKKQKELSRKARQLEKQQRRTTTRPSTSPEAGTAVQEPPQGANEQASSAET